MVDKTNDSDADILIFGSNHLPDQMPVRPLVTLAVLAYNQEEFIREAVAGAFAQDYEPLEIILSDDFSTDHTFEIMRELASSYEGSHKVIVRRNRKNIGTLAHILTLAKSAEGGYFVVAAGDDISLPSRVSCSISYFQALPSDVVVISGDDILFDESRSDFDGDSNILNRRQYHKANQAWFHGATACYKTSHLSALPVPEQAILYEDMALIAYFKGRNLLSGRIEKPLIMRRMHAANVGHIRKISNSDIMSTERHRLYSIASSAKAFGYSAYALREHGVYASRLSNLSKFLADYAQWPDRRFLGRLSLLVRSIPHGYWKPAALRLCGIHGLRLIRRVQAGVRNYLLP